MTATTQLSRITPYLSRLLEDEYIQEQLGRAITDLRRSTRRAKGQKATEALNDQKLRKQIRAALGSLTNAQRALTDPPRTRRRSPLVFLLIAASAGAVLTWQRRSAKRN